MDRERLKAASEALRKASELAEGDVQRRLYDQSNQLAALASRDEGPDHGRLDRHMNTLHEMAQETEGDLHDYVIEAREAVKSYRRDVPGV